MGNISARGSNHDPLLANPDINLRSGLSATDCGTLPGVTGNGMLMARQREVSVPHSLSLFMLILELPGMGVITGGVPAWDIAKPLVDEAIGQDPHPLSRGFSCFSALPRCRCLPRPSPTLPGSSGATARRSVGLAQAQPGTAGPAGAGLPAQGRHLRRAGRRVRHRHRHHLTVRDRNPQPCWPPAPRNSARR